MSQQPVLYVHIGGAKSGSTAIQHFLAMNYKLFRECGFAVLDEQGLPQPSPSSNQVWFFQGMTSLDDAIMANFREHMLGLRAHLDEHELMGVIFSAENLINPVGFERLFASVADLFDITIIAYVRNQQDLLPAAWKQWGFKSKETLDEWLIRNLGVFGNWYQYLIPWEDAFGQDHLRVRPFNRGLFLDGSIFPDFLHLINPALDIKDFVVPEKRINPSLNDRAFAAISRLVDFYDGPHDNRINHMVLHRAYDYAAAKLDANHVFSPGILRAIYEAYREDNEALCRKYFPDYSLSEIFPEKSDTPFHPLTENEVTQESVKVLWLLVLSLHEELAEAKRIIASNREVINRLNYLAARMNENTDDPSA